jgi:glycerophosphoryl diester phosphodiesterase
MRVHPAGPIVLALAAACGTRGSAPVSDAGPDAANAPIVDPKRFDCTSLAGGLPPRRATTTPECLRDPTCTTRLVSGHRGAGGQLGRIAPEDSLAAYRAAVVIGLDLVETDPRPTADGVLVNVHDPTLDRTTNGTGDVSATTFDAIRKLTLRSDLPGDWSCERVPTLREVLETSVGRALVLVDANKTDRVDLLVQAIEDAKALDWAVFDTSSVAKIDAALVLEPKLMIMPRVASVDEANAVLAHFAAHPPVFVEIDESVFPAAVAEIHAAKTRTFTDAFGVDLSVKFGGDRAGYLEVYGKGADVVQTDLPDEVLRALGRPVPP